MLAISRQTTNQILKDLEAQGILRLAYGGIESLICRASVNRHVWQTKPSVLRVTDDK